MSQAIGKLSSKEINTNRVLKIAPWLAVLAASVIGAGMLGEPVAHLEVAARGAIARRVATHDAVGHGQTGAAEDAAAAAAGTTERACVSVAGDVVADGDVFKYQCAVRQDSAAVTSPAAGTAATLRRSTARAE